MADIIELPEIRRRAARFRRVTQLFERGMDLEQRARIESVELTEAQLSYPRFSCGIKSVDRHLGGETKLAFQGMSAVGAETGLGKTVLAWGAAAESAKAGVCTLVFDGENGPGSARQWLLRRLTQPELEEISGTTLFYMAPSPEDALPSICRAVLERFQIDHTGILIVIDSFQAVTEMLMRNEKSEWIAQRTFLSWANWLVRESGGFARFLMLSELNADGALKGRKLSYQAQVVLQLKRPPMAGGDEVEIVCLKNRDGRHGSAGVFRLDWLHCQLIWSRSSS